MNAVLRGPYGQIVLGSATVTVGRTPDNQLVVNDPKVSSRQAEIRPTVQGYLVTDLGSSYGTFVDGQRLGVNVPRLLMPGNMIRFGDTTFTYEIAGTPVHQAQWSSAENQANFAPYPPPSTAYGAQTEYAPPPPSAYAPYQPGQPQSYTPPPSPAAYPPYDPTPQQSYGPYTPPPPTQQVSSRGPRGGSTILLIVLAVLVILAGTGLFFVIRNNQVATYNANATATAQAHATATATAQAHATATASAIVALQNPYTHSGTLALSDPLRDNSKGYGWSEDAPNCAFINGTYHAIAPDARYSDYCLVQATTFSDFAFEAQMQIIKGDAGGLAFRVTRHSITNDLYAFYIGQDGSYYLNLQNATGFPILTKGSSPAIHQGLNQTNLIAVVAQGSTIILYVNHQLITKVTDSTYTSGQLGVFVAPYNLPSEVVFSNVKVWTL